MEQTIRCDCLGAVGGLTCQRSEVAQLPSFPRARGCRIVITPHSGIGQAPSDWELFPSPTAQLDGKTGDGAAAGDRKVTTRGLAMVNYGYMSARYA